MKKRAVMTLPVVAALILFIGQTGFTEPGAPGVPDKKGDWSAGFASFRENLMQQKTDGWEYRKKVLLEYGLVVQPRNDVSLREWEDKDDAASRAIGRGKAALVFGALRKLAGDDAFSRAAANLTGGAAAGSWDEVRTQFEKEMNRDLGWFFLQWVDRKGLPELDLENAAVQRSGSGFEVSIDLVQRGDVYTLDIPVAILFLNGGSRFEVVKMDAAKKHAVFLVNEEPSGVVIDPDYEIPRKLTDAEEPPLLAKVLRDEKPLLVLPEAGADLYAGAIDAWKQRGAEPRKAVEIKDADVKASSLVVLGADSPLLNRLFGTVTAGSGALQLSARKNPWNADKVIVVVQGGSAASAAASVRHVSESGESSTLSIDARGRIVKETEAAERGISMGLRGETTAIEVSAIKTLSDVIAKASDKRIVYVGESHDRHAHHNVQLQVIRDLHRKDPKIAVGMEMFQRPFQQALDDYINGVIDEREFLKRSEYFKRWSFDYNLYKPILDFARAEKVPVVALNLRAEIIEKVSKSGIDSLTDDEKKDIPSQLDLSDDEYRERLKDVFDHHQGRGNRTFDHFYQSQVLWDETMALSIDEYLRKNPDRRMVVIAGIGHLAYGSGIPKRALRRNGIAYATILPDADVEPDIADYLVFPQPLEGMSAPRLMVMLKEEGGRVVVTALSEGSAARKAGVKAGDALIEIDGAPIKRTEDVKMVLFFKKHEETVTVRVMRKRFLLGDKEMEFAVKLP